VNSDDRNEVAAMLRKALEAMKLADDSTAIAGFAKRALATLPAPEPEQAAMLWRAWQRRNSEHIGSCAESAWPVRHGASGNLEWLYPQGWSCTTLDGVRWLHDRIGEKPGAIEWIGPGPDPRTYRDLFGGVALLAELANPKQDMDHPAAYGECGEAEQTFVAGSRVGLATVRAAAANGLGPVPELVWLGIAASTASRSSATAVRDYAIKAKARVEGLERLLLASQTTVTQWAVKHDKAEAALAAANERIEALLATGDEMDARIKELEREARERIAVNSALVRELAAANAKLAGVRGVAK